MYAVIYVTNLFTSICIIARDAKCYKVVVERGGEASQIVLI